VLLLLLENTLATPPFSRRVFAYVPAASLAEMIVAVWAWAIEKSAPQTMAAVGTMWKGLRTAQNRSARRLVVDYFVRIELLMRMPNLFLELLNFGDEALPF
jgi:hypothetical protein